MEPSGKSGTGVKHRREWGRGAARGEVFNTQDQRGMKRNNSGFMKVVICAMLHMGQMHSMSREW